MVLNMDKFITHRGVMAPLLRDNIDTDTIIPSREMKTVSKSGLGVGLFSAWRYLNEAKRIENPDFALNQAQYRSASILLSGKNFGCGSSREHAVWALKEYGFKCIIAQSYGSIFYRNCIVNGLLPISLKRADIIDLSTFGTAEINIDLNQQTIQVAQRTIAFDFPLGDKTLLLEGMDPISDTLKHKSEIAAFKRQDNKQRPWVYLT